MNEVDDGFPEELAAYLHDMPFPALVCGEDGRIVLANRPSLDLVGIQELRGEKIESIFPEAPIDRLASFLAKENAALGPRTALKSPGGCRDVQMALQSVGSGKRRFIAVYVRDAAPNEAQGSHWRAMIESVSEIIWETDVNLNFTYVSPRVQQARGRPPEYFIGRNLSDIVPPEYAGPMRTGALARKADPIRKDARPLSMRVKEALPDGRDAWVEVTAMPFIKDGALIGFIGSSRDVTAQKAMEDSMAEVKGRLEAFLKALPDMLFEVDKKKNIVWFNAAAGDSPYVSASSIKAEDVLSAEGVAGLDRAIEDADRDGKGTFRYSLPSMQGQRHYEAYVTPVPGNPSSHIFSVRDITEAVMMTEALQRANQRISLLSHFTRHDLINSMTVAEGNLRLCMEEADPMILKGRLEKVGRALREMRGLIVFYREYEEGGRGEPSWHDLSRLVRHEGQVLEQAGISLSVQEGVEAFVDPMFRKVIHNLLDNVAKHSVSARSCRVTFNDTNEGLRMAIEDDGQGIPDVYRSHLFQRGHGSGTGLGLYLSREILSMDGMEVIETSGPGQGARFVISIPPGRYRIRGGANVSL